MMTQRQLSAILRILEHLPVSKGAKRDVIARLVEAHLPGREGVDHQGGIVHGPALTTTQQALHQALNFYERGQELIRQHPDWDDAQWMEWMTMKGPDA